MDVDNMFIAKKFEKEMNNLVKQIEEKHLQIYIYIIGGSISKKITMKDSFQQKDVT